MSRTARIVWSGVKHQCETLLNLDAAGMVGYEDADQFAKWCVRDIAKNIDANVLWLLLKKESHPAGPLAMALPDADWHWNGLMKFDRKLLTVPHDTFVVADLMFHITFAHEQGGLPLPALRLVSACMQNTF